MEVGTSVSQAMTRALHIPPDADARPQRERRPFACYTVIAHAQPAPPPPQHPPPPATAVVCPLASVENDMNTDSCRRDSDPQSGHGAGSSIWSNSRSFSKVFEHVPHVYSYNGIKSKLPSCRLPQF